MNEQDILARLETLEKKIDAVGKTASQIRSFFLWTLVATAVGFFLPLIGLAFVIPYYLSTLQGLM